MSRAKNVITSIYLVPEVEEKHNLRLQAKLAAIRRSEVRYHEVLIDDAEYVVVGFGTAGRVAQTAVRQARAQGIRAGLFRPISLYPSPEGRLTELARQAQGILVVEMNAGQMLEDVRLAVGREADVRFCGRMGGVAPLPDEVLGAIQSLASGEPGAGAAFVG